MARVGTRRERDHADSAFLREPQVAVRAGNDALRGSGCDDGKRREDAVGAHATDDHVRTSREPEVPIRTDGQLSTASGTMTKW